MPFRHHMIRMLMGPREPTVADLKAETRALAQERLARHATRPDPSPIEVLPADPVDPPTEGKAA